MNGPCDVILVFVNDNERNAVYEVFRERNNRAADVLPGEVLTYHDFGIIGGAKVLGLQIQMGSTTRGGSATALSEAIKEKTPRYVILVGIAFAMNREKHGIGDILVSDKLSLYEMRRIGIDKKGEDVEIIRGDTASAPEQILGKFKALSGSTHWQGAPVRFGLMLSGEKLIDNPEFKTKLHNEYPEAIGGEMEAAGAYISAEFYKKDWIVIKAVCDYADGNKKRNKERNQQLAAKNAAELVFHVLEKGNFGNVSSRLPKKKSEPKELGKPPGVAIKKIVKENIIQLLGKKKMERFRRTLQDQFNKDNPGNGEEVYEINRMTAMLTDMNIVDAIDTLGVAVKDCIETIKDADGNPDLIDGTWKDSLGIVGWLVLLAVDDDWAESTSQCLAQKGEPLNTIIPVYTEAGAETAFSRIKKTRAQFAFNNTSQSVESKKAIPYREGGIEDGEWGTPGKLSTIKKTLWKQLIKSEPPAKGELTDDYISRELKQTLKTRARKGEHYYMAVNLSCQDNPLLEEEVCNYLASDLGLEIFLIGSDEQKVAIILEPELNAVLREFFRCKPE